MTTGKTRTLTGWTFVGKVMSLLFNMLSRLVIVSLPKSKRLLISWLQTPSEAIAEPQKIKSLTLSTVSPSICHEVIGPDAMILLFECWVLSQLFHCPFSLSSRGLLVPLHFLAIKVVSSAYLRLLIFLLAILIPACTSSSSEFLLMYPVYTLNKQGDNIQPWRTRFPIFTLVAQRLKHLPAMRETRVRSLGQEDSPGEGNGNPLQYFCLENPMDGGTWWATVHGVAKSQTRLNDFTFTINVQSLLNRTLKHDLVDFIPSVERYFWHSLVCLVKAIVFPVVMYGCESWTIKKAEC